MTEAKNKKITKRERFEQLKKIDEVANNQELMDFIEHELELLARKNSSGTGEKKLTPVQVANNGIKEIILDVLANTNTLMTVTDIIKAHTELNDLSNQRVSALLRQLVNDSKVEKITDKRKSFFKVAE